ncbi:hypothetical protein [Ruegeria atlantica]|uniref:hypothetical protein n=1 Tax=Ruegeria atlantica TaxID=81569 RepID=UPI00147F26FC|nr:hypothetical protein [Ruegeria atlantica]
MAEKQTQAVEVPDIADQNDPLEGLIDRVKSEGKPAAFEVPTLAALGALDRDNPAEFERLLADLKGQGVGLTVLRQKIKQHGPRGDGSSDSQLDTLAEVMGEFDLFCDAAGTAYASGANRGIWSTVKVRSSAFREALVLKYYEATDSAPNNDALGAAVNLASAKAHHTTTRREVGKRYALHDGLIYVYRADPENHQIRINPALPDGFEQITAEESPVRFLTRPELAELPEPVAPSDRDKLLMAFQQLTPFERVDNFRLFVAAILDAMQPEGPHVVTIITGLQDSGKSKRMQMFTRLVDPQQSEGVGKPKGEWDIFCEVRALHCLAYDNLSGMSGDVSDVFSRIAYGGTFRARTHHQMDEFTSLTGCCPVVLAGIGDFVVKADLIDRSVFLRVEPIAAENRLPDAELWARFEALQPELLGLFYGALAEGIRNRGRVLIVNAPRMVDFLRRVSEAEPALWDTKGLIDAAFRRNLIERITMLLNDDPFALAVFDLMDGLRTWEGTATALQDALKDFADEETRSSRLWPSNPTWLGRRLPHVANTLRHLGVKIETDSSHTGTHRKIQITYTPDDSLPDSGDELEPLVIWRNATNTKTTKQNPSKVRHKYKKNSVGGEL